MRDINKVTIRNEIVCYWNVLRQQWVKEHLSRVSWDAISCLPSDQRVKVIRAVERYQRKINA